MRSEGQIVEISRTFEPMKLEALVGLKNGLAFFTRRLRFGTGNNVPVHETFVSLFSATIRALVRLFHFL